MNNDLKIIKKKYGEKMMQLCRELFITIIENSPGMLVSILLKTFAPSHFLYDDLTDDDELLVDFKNYIYGIYNNLKSTQEKEKMLVEDPVTLLRRAGYTLYVCQSETEIQKFRKYYIPEEMLCTFTHGDRLRSCYVYFAVKDNANKLKRSDFPNPNRQDEYGTSVISIQFTRDSSHTLSIKNRYNHTVENPDATYSNNLDNIISGLSQSFADYYGMRQLFLTGNSFEIPGYVRANDGKLYKYNYELNNVYYCPNNIVIDNFKVTKYEKEKYLVMDYFVLDLVNKKISNLLFEPFNDSFPETIGNIKNINIQNTNLGKNVIITPEEGTDIILRLNKFNRIVSVKNNNVLEVPPGFLQYASSVEKILLNSVITIGENFLFGSYTCSEISLPNVEVIGGQFLMHSQVKKINFPKVKKIGNKFLLYNQNLKTLEFPELVFLGDDFLMYNNTIQNISLPKVINIGRSFLETNSYIEVISFPQVKIIGDFFCYSGESIEKLYLPKVMEIGNSAICYNQKIIDVNIPKSVIIGQDFLRRNYNFHVNKLRTKKLQVKEN